MVESSKLSESVQALLRCPVCGAVLRAEDGGLACTAAGCAVRYPVVNGIPVLINEANSVFSHADFSAGQDTTWNTAQRRGVKRLLDRLVPDISRNVKGEANYRRLTELLLAETARPRVLVLGGSILGRGMEPLAANPAIELVESDVSFGPRTALICDAHDVPFEDAVFDAVIVQAVLEHVVDPYRCVAEIHRVLRAGGLVYAETPFMQQVHMGRYDFTRFTHLGHRRLFRHFSEVDSGAVCGPGMALAWSYRYFLASFTTRRKLRSLARIFSAWTGFWLKYFDGPLIDTPGTLDAAAGYYFLGRKSETTLSDRELLTLYRGAQRGN